jgi:hypothetical protein
MSRNLACQESSKSTSEGQSHEPTRWQGEAALADAMVCYGHLPPREVAILLHGEIVLHWESGRHLPTDLELARTYGVNMPTIRAALRHLERMGIILRDIRTKAYMVRLDSCRRVPLGDFEARRENAGRERRRKAWTISAD